MAQTIWKPTEAEVQQTRLYQWMNKLGYSCYESFYDQSVADISWFWKEVEQELGIQWHEHYTDVVNLNKGIQWPKWFVNGKTNVVSGALEKWYQTQPHKVALVWEGEDGQVIRLTYKELEAKVTEIATGLKALNVHKGDRIALYMPMIPETVIAMLAISKIGAIYIPNFSGFAADAVAKRIEASGAKVLITADGFYRRGKVVSMKAEADKAVEQTNTIERVVVCKRIGHDISWNDNRDVDWNELKKTAHEGKSVHTESMDSNDPFMIIYTSGTTGKPKGVVHSHTGFPIKSAFDAGICMDLQQDDVLFWLTDMGWMMGPFLVYGSLINGATMVMYEGSPDYPQVDRLWDLVENHNITHLGISPTLIRSLKKQGEKWLHNRELSSLRVLASTGEPWDHESWHWLFENVGQKRLPIFNYSGGTEISGGILGNVLIKPMAPVAFTGPLPGMDAAVYDENGQEVKNEKGELVLRQPWVGMANGFWQEADRYMNTYWSRFNNTWVHGDWVVIDDDGHWTITGRSDDTLNIAGKRLGPSEMETILNDHEAVVEAAVIGVPDDVKGEAAVSFVVVHGAKGSAKSEEGNQNDQLALELKQLVAERLGKALQPKSVHIVSALPKTRNGKVMRRVIRASYLRKDEGDLSALENPELMEEIRRLNK